MLRSFLVIFFVMFFFAPVVSQQISSGDLIQDKVILYLPNATKSQLDNVAAELEKHPQIKNAVYVPGVHHCLLMEIRPDNNIKFFGDAMKIVTMHIPVNEIILKTPSAYAEIYGKGNDGSYVTLKK